ncbi:MAG: hypothetical protein JJ855_08760 [Rhodospirillales bacterium]|nr:hypothetical protein [Rhodospirillales bacterium]
MMRRQVKKVMVSGIVTVLVITVVVFAVLQMYLSLDRESRLAEELSNGLNDLQYLTTEYLATGTPRALKQWQDRHESLGSFLDNARVRNPESARLLPELKTRLTTLGSVFGKLTRIESAIPEPARAAAAKRAALSRLLNQILALSALKDRISSIYRERQESFALWGTVVVTGVLLSGIVLMVILYLRVLRVITANVERLSTEIVRVGEGELTNPVQFDADGDIGRVFQAVEQARIRLADAVRKMEQERADLDSFVYVASHDFKAPLRGIDNLATWLEEDAGAALTDESREHIHMMRRRITRLESLLDDLLAYSRAGRAEIAFETVDVGEMLRDMKEDLQLPPGFNMVVAEDMPVICSPRTPLAHVFFNLISNAVKHHDSESGRIEITSEELFNGHAFIICDDGPGIPPKYRERVFEMFQTLKPRDVIEGSGMGLAITKRLVQGNNGTISIIGEGDGRGTCIRFTWHPAGGGTGEAVK